MDTIPVQISTLSSGNRDTVMNALNALKVFFDRRQDITTAQAIFEAGGVPAFVAVLQNFENDDEIVWTACQVLIFIMFMNNDPDARIRRSFLHAGGVTILVDILGNDTQEFVIPISYLICCIFLWMADDKSMRLELTCTCCSAAAIEKIMDAIKRYNENEGFVVCGTLLLASMDDKPALRSQLASALSDKADHFHTLLEAISLHSAREEVVFSCCRLLCSLLVDPDTTLQIHNVVNTQKITESLLEMAPLHETHGRIQGYMCQLFDLLTEREEFLNSVDVTGLTEALCRAIDHHSLNSTLMKCCIRVLTKVLKKRNESARIFKEGNVAKQVRQALRSHKTDSKLQASGHGYLRMLACKSRDHVEWITLSLRRPILTLTCAGGSM